MMLPPLRKKKPHERVINPDGLALALHGPSALLEAGSDNAMSPAGESTEEHTLKSLLDAVESLKAQIAAQQASEETLRLEALMQELKSYDAQIGAEGEDDAEETDYP